MHPALGYCWVWTAYIERAGYGLFSVGGVPLRAHRVSWNLASGEIPPGQVVRHRCDVRRCVRPDHLELGTKADNNRDTHERDRWRWVAPGFGVKPVWHPPQKRGPKAKPVAERFWPKVQRSSPDACWLWLGKSDARGYGLLAVGGRYGGAAKAHRVSYELANGPIPEGMHVLHSCDTPACVNPAHLRAGTNAENVADRAARRRGREHRQRGEANLRAKLTEADVAAIRAAVSAGETQANVAARFGIVQQQVSRIVNGVQWT